MEQVETTSVAETLAFGRRFAGSASARFAERLGRGDCVALVGQLGAGKTVLVRGIAAGLGVADDRLVASPTFVLVREYEAREWVFHVDCYRLGDPSAELTGLGLGEMLAEGVVLIEWADRAAAALPRRHWRITIDITGETSRRLGIERVA